MPGDEQEKILAPFPTASSEKSTEIAVQCCKVGVSGNAGCVRYVDTNDANGCIGGRPPRMHTYVEAVNLCIEAGSKIGVQLTLCDRTCRNTGCAYNNAPVCA